VRTPDGATAEHVGGSPANVALGLSRLGHDTWFATLVGTDDRGIRCAQHVEDGGVRLLPGSISPTHPTSTAAATIDDSGAASYVFDLHWDPRRPAARGCRAPPHRLDRHYPAPGRRGGHCGGPPCT
jgi:fructokinase